VVGPPRYARARHVAGQKIAGASFVVTGTEVGKENPDRKSLSASVEATVQPAR
jgi:hypothetical protein